MGRSPVAGRGRSGPGCPGRTGTDESAGRVPGPPPPFRAPLSLTRRGPFGPEHTLQTPRDVRPAPCRPRRTPRPAPAPRAPSSPGSADGSARAPPDPHVARRRSCHARAGSPRGHAIRRDRPGGVVPGDQLQPDDPGIGIAEHVGEPLETAVEELDEHPRRTARDVVQDRIRPRPGLQAVDDAVVPPVAAVMGHDAAVRILRRDEAVVVRGPGCVHVAEPAVGAVAVMGGDGDAAATQAVEQRAPGDGLADAPPPGKLRRGS